MGNREPPTSPSISTHDVAVLFIVCSSHFYRRRYCDGSSGNRISGSLRKKDTSMNPIDALFDRMDTWRHFPNYQLERRADLFFASYLP
jgi:hypothetical protein